MMDLRQMMTNLPRGMIIIAVVLAVFSYLLYNFTIGTQLAKLGAVNFQITAQKKLIDAREKDLKGINELKEQYEGIERHLKMAEESFVDEAGFSRFFQDIRDIVRMHGCDIMNLFVRSKEPLKAGNEEGPDDLSDNYEKLPIELSVKGGYIDVVSAIFDLMEQPYLVELYNFKIEGAKDDPFSIRADLLLKAYVRKEKAEAAK